MAHFILVSIFLNFISWQLYTSNADGFSLLVPADPEVKTTRFETAIGIVEERIYTMRDTALDTDNDLYMISVTVYPDELISGDSIDVILIQSHIEEASKALDGQLLYTNTVTLQGIEGKLYKTSYNEGQASVKGKVFLLGNKLYSIRVFTRKSRSNNDDINRFLDSFRWQDVLQGD